MHPHDKLFGYPGKAEWNSSKRTRGEYAAGFFGHIYTDEIRHQHAGWCWEKNQKCDKWVKDSSIKNEPSYNIFINKHKGDGGSTSTAKGDKVNFSSEADVAACYDFHKSHARRSYNEPSCAREKGVAGRIFEDSTYDSYKYSWEVAMDKGKGKGICGVPEHLPNLENHKHSFQILKTKFFQPEPLARLHTF